LRWSARRTRSRSGTSSDGTHVTTLPQPNGSWSHGFAFDGQGSRLVNVTNAGVLEMWDVDRELNAAPISIERVEQPVGIAADGTVLTVGDGANGEDILTLWTRQPVGRSARLGSAV
jgi:hypothetical protein